MKTALLSAMLLACCMGATPLVAAEASEEQPKPKDLGPPLVDEAASLKRLSPSQPIWLDVKQKQVVLVGESCKASYPLEFFATLPGREYEAVVVVDVLPSLVHAGLLALGAQPGSPARFQPKFQPASGTEVDIEVRWKDKDGKVQKCPAQDFVRNIRTKKRLEVSWVFAGSSFSVDEDTGKRHYRADGGDFISVSNVPIASLDLPIESSTGLDDRLFEGNPDRVPPKGTPLTLILKPKLKTDKEAVPPKS